ncbi:hydroxyacid dehydrogenase [Streptomyces sp. HNM0574]|uniref:hydroxyacid dehydrogenase n=1 Tax=Streptomyces sp. HNM0574 TaxID=2714954 RepID=UPI00146BFE19|nr:hydroxyacid dehydrogenase [Streptomyces sp. HNM0574]NLU70171.1 hydroxyacid dehydrogenase [Streptomyces sp. HNM0574]
MPPAPHPAAEPPHGPDGRPRAAVAMSAETADGLLTPGVPEALRRHVRLAPLPPLDEFASPRARAALAEAELLVTGWGCPPLDEAALAAAPRLRAVVHTAGSVREHLTPACWERGLAVSSAATANALPVAEYAVAMILLAGKRVLESARDYREGRTRPGTLHASPHTGNYRRTVGILSASLVGRRVIELLRPHDLEVLLHDPYVTGEEARALGVRAVPLPELFASCDVVSVHTPLLPGTRGLVGRELLAAMRPDATLVNTARGPVLDQEALTELLLRGRLRAVLDVTEPEPLPPGHPLWSCPNVLLTPHIAGSQGNELRRLADTAVAEVERWAGGAAFAHPVSRERLDHLA